MTIERKNESISRKIPAPLTQLTGQISGTNKQRMLPTPSELVALLSKQVIGQAQAKQTLAAAVYQHFMNCANSDLYGGRIEAENHVMIIGPSGSGKSLLLRTLRDVLKAPMFYIPCTNITPDGYKGKKISQHIEAISEVLIVNNYTPPAIVVWDEVDKLSMNSLYSSDGQGSNDVAAGAGVYPERQAELHVRPLHPTALLLRETLHHPGEQGVGRLEANGEELLESGLDFARE